MVQFVRKREGSLHLSDALIRKSNHGANHGVAKVRTDAWIVAAILKRLSRDELHDDTAQDRPRCGTAPCSREPVTIKVGHAA